MRRVIPIIPTIRIIRIICIICQAGGLPDRFTIGLGCQIDRAWFISVDRVKSVLVGIIPIIPNIYGWGIIPIGSTIPNITDGRFSCRIDRAWFISVAEI